MAAQKDAIAERLRARLKALMDEQGLDQKALHLRSGEPVYRVHKFVKGDLPFPPLTFLDRVFGVFGLSLEQALKGETTRQPLPIHRADVRAVADVLEGCSEEYVKALHKMVMTAPRSGARRTGTSPAAPRVEGSNRPKTRATQGRTSTRDDDE